LLEGFYGTKSNIMQKLLLFGLFLCLLITSCKKSDAPTGFNSPVFIVSYGTDSMITTTAGLDGVYLFTRYELDVEVFKSISTFADVSCPTGDCPGSLRFEFRHNAVVDSAFSGGQYKYSQPDSLAQTLSYLTNFFWKDNFSYTFQTFNILGNSFSTPLSQIEVELSNQPIKISLIALDSVYGTRSVIERSIAPGNQDAFPGVNLQAIAIGNNFQLTAQPFGTSVIQYAWNTGDTSASISTDSIFQLDEYIVTVTDDFGNTASASLGNLSPNQQTISTANVAFEAIVVDFNPLQIGTVAIEWIDSAGTSWRSDRQKQLDFASFEVLNAEDYEPNENGDFTRKLTVHFRCLLYDEGGEAKEFSGEGVIAMARP
jgi:hypothetical protein